MKLYVLTKSLIKINALIESKLFNLFNGIEIIDKDKYEDDIKVEQPYGEGGKIICKKRIDTFIKNYPFLSKEEEPYYILSIENYITNFYDIPIICIYNGKEKIYNYYEGLKAEYPEYYNKLFMNIAKPIYIEEKLVGYDITLGNIIKKNEKEKNNIDIDNNNWIGNFNYFERIEQIKFGLNKFNDKLNDKFNDL
jgi:hypothetical protein